MTIHKRIQSALEHATSDPKFWGSVTVQIQGGKPVIVRTEQTEKLNPQEVNNPSYGTHKNPQ